VFQHESWNLHDAHPATDVCEHMQLVQLLTKDTKYSSSQITTSSSQLSHHAVQLLDTLDMRVHAASALIEVLCLCNSKLSDSSSSVPVAARRQVEGLEVDVSDEIADSLWAFAEGLLDEKCRLLACVAELEESSDPGMLPSSSCLSLQFSTHKLSAHVW
jgi:hypothetical protein